MSTVKDDLLKAADYIDEHGWCQGNYGIENGPCCAAGALRQVTNFRVMNLAKQAAGHRYHKACSAVEMLTGETITIWNDRPERTKAEVIAALRAAAEAVA